MNSGKGAPRVLDRIRRYNRGRDPERLALKYRAMHGSALAFLRGTCHLFYEALPAARVLQGAPAAWTCGDLHVENFGTFRGDNRLVYFDLNDFDEAVLAPCTWDLVRLLASIALAAREVGVSAREARGLLTNCTQAYREALLGGKARWIERAIAEGMVRELIVGLRRRTRKAFVAGRITARGARRAIRIDRVKTLPLAAGERARWRRALQRALVSRYRDREFRIHDVARRVAGTGSLGIARFVALAESRHRPGDYHLLDVKQALPPALAHAVPVRQPRWRSEAERVSTIQQRMQAIPPARLVAIRIGSDSYVVKELQPTQDRLDWTRWGGKLARLRLVTREMGELLAWAQLRASGRQGAAAADDLIAFAGRRRWPREIVACALKARDTVTRQWESFCRDFPPPG
jgi:uncharacterized protein (DUF2252 family)